MQTEVRLARSCSLFSFVWDNYHAIKAVLVQELLESPVQPPAWSRTVPSPQCEPWFSRRGEVKGLLGKPHVLYLCAAVFPRKSGTSKVTAMSMFLLKTSLYHCYWLVIL